jgi:hypothetical protein
LSFSTLPIDTFCLDQSKTLSITEVENAFNDSPFAFDHVLSNLQGSKIIVTKLDVPEKKLLRVVVRCGTLVRCA